MLIGIYVYIYLYQTYMIINQYKLRNVYILIVYNQSVLLIVSNDI